MTEKTRELLEECAKVGYKVVTVLSRDKRVPRSMSIRPGPWFGNEATPSGDKTPIRVICGFPERLGEHFAYPGNYWPQMWSVIKKCELVNGMQMGGHGMGDCHDINGCLAGDLTPGCYELPEALKQ